MNVVEKRIEMLKVQNDKLKQLLDDPHPGLSTWMEMVPMPVVEMQRILDGEKDE